MADYYTLLSRAVVALPENTSEARQIVYGRAKTALTGYLMKLDPPASPANLAIEMESIDAAIRRIELEFFNPLQADLAGKDSPSQVAAPLEIKRPLAPKPMPETGSNKWLLWAGAAIVVLMGGLGIAALYLPNHPFDQKKPSNDAMNQIAKAKDAQPKIIERVGSGEAPVAPVSPTPETPETVAQTAPSSSTSVAVAQRAAVLVQVPNTDKTKNEPLQQKAFVGTVVWHLVDVTGGAGQPLQKAVRADVHIPAAKTDVTIIIQKNLDSALPASHTFQIDFTLALGGPINNVQAISMPELRDEAAPSGSPLLGAPAAITDNHFIVALAEGKTAEAQNLELLKARPWIDIPLITGDHLLAKITIEKGVDGDAAISDAMKAWNQ